MRAKPLSYVGDFPLVIVSTIGITADHENWIEQQRKQESYLIRRFYSELLRYNYDSEALGTKLQIFHDSIVSQFPEET